ncbi:MAG: hypothetical protein NC410_09190 [Oscillibacter sp.]|nr:hypothetical protein [Oscillibacter sp.]
MPKQYYAALMPRSVNDALQSITPPLSVFKKEYGEQSLQAILVIVLNDVIKFFNVGKTMDLEQVVQTILLIMEDFYYFNIEDFKLCFNNAKRGKYGKVYDRIDGNIIYEWLQKYSEERVQTAYPKSSYRPEVASKDERISNKRDREFENFRISYIAEKSLHK